MILAYKYARKRLNERKAGEAGKTVKDSNNVAEGNAVETSVVTTAAPETHQDVKDKKHKSPEDIRADRKRRSYRWKVILGLWGPFALQALDTTIIASALPYIAASFDETKQLNWIISAFNLSSAAFLPAWAQLNDIFGRHAALQAAIVTMMIGSALCTGVNVFPVLLLGRALQGVGAAGINISVRTVLADSVSLR